MDDDKLTFEPDDVIDGRYKVVRLIGKGGMGMVYLVVDKHTGQRLALKTLLPKYAANEHAVTRFLDREVAAARKLNHPAIVRVYEAVRIGELLYYTMDYVEGKRLRAWLKEKGRLSFGSTVRVCALIAHALEHAHQYTIHRDISPENIMVLPDGSVRLLDFGLAKLTDPDMSSGQANLTMVGVTMGKHQYNSPEMLTNAAGADHRADLFSLGVIFFEMLTGRRPKGGDSITQLVPGLPFEAEAFFKKATAFSVNDRFNSACEFREELLRIYRLYKDAGIEGFDSAPSQGVGPVASSAPAGQTARPFEQQTTVPTRPPRRGIWRRLLGFFGGGK